MRKKVNDSYRFIEDKRTFLAGAFSEEVVISTLSRLPDDYHIINDANLQFSPPIHWKEKDETIYMCQIDHIVIGPTGIF